VLVLGAGEATEVWTAVAHGAARVTAVELDPGLGAVVRCLAAERSRDSTPRASAGDRRRTPLVAASAERFDLVTFGIAGGGGLAGAATRSAGEDFLHTVDAYVACLEHLRRVGRWR